MYLANASAMPEAKSFTGAFARIWVSRMTALFSVSCQIRSMGLWSSVYMTLMAEKQLKVATEVGALMTGRPEHLPEALAMSMTLPPPEPMTMSAPIFGIRSSFK